MRENLRELMTLGEIDLEEREKFEERYREEQKVLKKQCNMIKIANNSDKEKV